MDPGTSTLSRHSYPLTAWSPEPQFRNREAMMILQSLCIMLVTCQVQHEFGSSFCFFRFTYLSPWSCGSLGKKERTSMLTVVMKGHSSLEHVGAAPQKQPPHALHLWQDTGFNSESPLPSRLFLQSCLACNPARLCVGQPWVLTGGQGAISRMCSFCPAGDLSFSTRKGGALALLSVRDGAGGTMLALPGQPCSFTLLSRN